MQLFSLFSPEATFWHALSLYASVPLDSFPVNGAVLVDSLRRARSLQEVCNDPEFARRCCLAAALSPESLAATTSEALRDLTRETLERCWPRLATDLPLRARPFLELWEARGPGLLRQVLRRWSDSDSASSASHKSSSRVVDACRVVWVPPIQGGGGWSAPSLSAVVFEAMLVNPLPAIPEPVRFAWLLLHATLGVQTPALTRVARLEQLALLPATLAAGEFVEWTMCDERHITLAAQLWLGMPPARASELGPKLLAWWQICEVDSSGDWKADLQRLDEHLPPHFLES